MAAIIHTISKNQNAYAGVEISKLSTEKDEVFSVHREDYCTFVFLQNGVGTIVIETEDIKVTSPSIIILSPLQAHYLKEVDECKGYNLDIENFLIPNAVIHRLQSLAPAEQILNVDAIQVKRLMRTADMLYDVFEDSGSSYKREIIVHMALALIFQALDYLPIAQRKIRAATMTQGESIVDSFMMLISKTLQVHSPSFYAKQLHISVSHLNDSVKLSTGYTSSYWIQYFITIEAKRLLYHTDLSIKEIAFELGFNDSSYFTRFYKSNTGFSPLAFRATFCDLS